MSQLFQDFGSPATGQKVCLATTAYENPDCSYTFSIQRSREALEKAGIQTAYFLLSGNCHVDDARNVMVQEFLLSDCTDLLFLDADVSWRPEQIVRLCQHSPVDIVGGVYPFRDGEKTKAGDMPVRMLPATHKLDSRGLLPVAGLPTGFMRISRHVLAKLAYEATDKYWNKLDRRSKVPVLFEREMDGEIRWGGDLNFCRKARSYGFIVHADYEMSLGHAGKTIFTDSLGSALRKQSGSTLRYVCDHVRSGTYTIDMISEARRYVDNLWGALEDVLLTGISLARSADGPIIETGSGLSTILMAAANPDQTVYCLEHDPFHAANLRKMVAESGVKNIGLCMASIKDGWYDLGALVGLPDSFAFGLNDGPPRSLGSRSCFYEHFGDKVGKIVVDDADDPDYMDFIKEWAGANGMKVDFIPERCALISKKEKDDTLEAR